MPDSLKFDLTEIPRARYKNFFIKRPCWWQQPDSFLESAPSSGVSERVERKNFSPPRARTVNLFILLIIFASRAGTGDDDAFATILIEQRSYILPSLRGEAISFPPPES